MIEALANAIVKPAGKHACSTPTTGRAVGSRSPKRSTVGSAFLVDVADDILAIDCDSADRVEVVQEIATELQGHGYRPFGLLPVGPVTNICSSPSFVRASSRAASNHGANFTVESRVGPRGQNPGT